MLSVNITDKEWTILISENEWKLIVAGLLTNQIVKTKAPIKSGDVIYWTCTEGDMFLSKYPHLQPQKGKPSDTRIEGKMMHVKSAASVVYPGSTNPKNPIKRDWVSIDFITGTTEGITEDELAESIPEMQKKLDENPSSLKVVKHADGNGPADNLFKTSKNEN